MIARLKNLGWWVVGLILLVLAAFAGGKRKGTEQAEQIHRREDAERVAAAGKKVVEAAQVRQEVEDETARGGTDAARKNLKDRWTQL